MSELDIRIAYKSARWRADEPEGGWSESFGVVTAWNPNGKIISDEENAERTEALCEELYGLERKYFPVTGYDLESDHYEEGFGIACDRDKMIKLGKKWDQLAVFWMEDGWVWLIFCEPGGESCKLRTLEAMLGGNDTKLDGGPGEP